MGQERPSHEPERLFSEEAYDEEPIRVAPKCKICGAEAPAVSSDHSLISKRGWRLVLEVDLSGRRVGAWHCPECSTRRRAVMRNSMRSP
ncbi:MAG: hypothetical protein ABTD50_14425 [Polyangiaceae bacterium]|jgi:hypothetical protein